LGLSECFFGEADRPVNFLPGPYADLVFHKKLGEVLAQIAVKGPAEE
jgi:hypothetical protein